MIVHERLDLGDAIGLVAVDSYSSGNIYLEAVDTSAGAGEAARGLVILTRSQALNVAASLIRAASE